MQFIPQADILSLRCLKRAQRDAIPVIFKLHLSVPDSSQLCWNDRVRFRNFERDEILLQEYRFPAGCSAAK